MKRSQTNPEGVTGQYRQQQPLNIMAGTFSQIYIQAVFAVKGRENLLQKSWRDDVFKYMSGIIKGKNHKPIIVNGVADHVHLFIGLRPAMAISDLIRDIKNNSTNYINKRGLIPGSFAWQDGYGAFSYSHSQLNNVYQYILNQEEHHRKKTFREEYLAMLDEFEIPHDEKYLFDWIL
jgi:putative transposase